MARSIVAEHLDVLVARNDDGSAPSQPDGMILLTDGTEAALEVITDNDVPFRRLWDALERSGHRIELPAGAQAWHVSLHHRAQMKTLRRVLPDALASLPTEPFRGMETPADSWLAGEDHVDVLDMLSAIGVATLMPIENGTGYVAVTTHGWSNWENVVPFIPWVQQTLEREHDVASKLLKAGTTQRHAFIWATSGSPFAVLAELAMGDEDEHDAAGLPDGFLDELGAAESEAAPARASLPDPELPDGITHLWVGSRRSNKSALYWSPDGGWEQTAWRTPSSEHAIEQRIGRDHDDAGDDAELTES
ncbi:MAG: hypothetical protein V4737_10955 [Curtobacterium sp.]